MIATWGRYLDTLFGGGAGGPASEVAHEGLTAVLWFVLFAIARRRMREDPTPRERLLVWAFGIAALRDFNLFFFYSLDVAGLFPVALISRLLLPLDHLLSLASVVGISAAYIRYFLKDDALTRRFIAFSAAGSVLAYAVFLAFPILRSGEPSWYDRPMHLVSSGALAAAMVFFYRQRGWMRNVLLLGFSFFLLHDLLILLPWEPDAAAQTLIHSLRHGLRVGAIIMLAFLYAREMRQERADAQKALREALEASENERRRTETIMSFMGDAVHLLDPELKIIYQNRASLEMAGDHLGEFCYRAFRHQDSPCPACPILLAFQDGGIHTVERHPEMLGTIRHLEINASAMRDASGRILAGIEVVRDITDRLRTEEDLRIKNRALEHSISAIAMADPRGRLTYVNPAFLSLWGYQREEEVLGRQVTEFWVSPTEAAAVVQAIGESGSWVGEMTGRRLDGTPVLLQVAASVILDAEGMPLCLMAWFMDITTRKRAEEALRHSEESNRMLVEFSPLGILVHDEGRIVVANPAAATLLRAAGTEALIGMHVMRFIPREFQPLVDQRYRDLHREERKLAPTEYQVIAFDGARIDVEMVSRSLRHQGRFRVLTIMRDISGRKRAESQLRKANEELEKRYQELQKLDVIKDGLLRDVSHELKTPVAKQAMQLELLRTALDGELTPRMDKILEVMEASVRRQEQVIRNLLDLSRLESGGRRFNIRPVRIDRIMERVAADYRPLIESSSIELAESLQELVVKGDEEMLWHVFSNLLSNAIKFRRQGQPSRIEFRLLREGGEAVARVIDDGIGLESRELSRVFDRFYQASPTVEGSGVGLSLCKAMVTGMGGAIALESEGPGMGVTAVVRLPLG